MHQRLRDDDLEGAVAVEVSVAEVAVRAKAGCGDAPPEERLGQRRAQGSLLLRPGLLGGGAAHGGGLAGRHLYICEASCCLGQEADAAPGKGAISRAQDVRAFDRGAQGAPRTGDLHAHIAIDIPRPGGAGQFRLGSVIALQESDVVRIQCKQVVLAGVLVAHDQSDRARPSQRSDIRTQGVVVPEA